VNSDAVLENHPLGRWAAGDVEMYWMWMFAGLGKIVIRFHWIEGEGMGIRNVSGTNRKDIWVEIDVHVGVVGTAHFENVEFLTSEVEESQRFLHGEV
jgi:hypothetical protein